MVTCVQVFPSLEDDMCTYRSPDGAADSARPYLPLNRQGHARNAAFLRGHIAHMVRRIGLLLPGLIEGEEQRAAARQIEVFLWRELGHAARPTFAADLPSFLLAIRSPQEPRRRTLLSLPMLSRVLTNRLAAIELPAAPKLCHVAVNLSMLGKLLHCNEIERQWLLWAYCWNRSSRMGLPFLPLHDVAHGYEVLALLWDMPVAAIRANASPNRLRALRLLDAPLVKYPQGEPIWFNKMLACTEHFLHLVEAPHRNHASLLNQLREPEADWILNQDDGSTRDFIRERMPPTMVECYQRMWDNQPLDAEHIAALVAWLCQLHIPPNAFSALVGRLTLLTVREAIQRAAFDCCRQQRPFTAVEILKALHAAAGL
jgi:hypothetical protein